MTLPDPAGPPDETTILAARYLDAIEGPVQIGSTVDAATRFAINQVLRYVAAAHSAHAPRPVEICELPHTSDTEEEECEEQRLGSTLLGADEEVERAEIIHALPPVGSGLTPCCGRTPFELPLTDRISSEVPITCGRLLCPRCQEDITDYDEDDHVFLGNDNRPYCSHDCVVAAWRATHKNVTIHGTPQDKSGRSSCCGRTLFELPDGDWMSDEGVTCRAGAPDDPPQEPAPKAKGWGGIRGE